MCSGNVSRQLKDRGENTATPMNVLIQENVIHFLITKLQICTQLQNSIKSDRVLLH